ncbi:DUF3592 domain-containing protein [Corallococcus llansteffanensis]|uniref:DUF3592 domain-containing protein n=1 Tax=Corallococcus llansteffanensis TaxID=2316731 RepID=A0A3A8QJE4_9BACT|nr:DUF3592 domain-containing protein [Corallococcus llansteffanensis]RKH67040.1 DUF3592 domain-containing protein [Corallococcus llansteffanensis]
MSLLAARVLGASFAAIGLTVLVLTWGMYRRDSLIVEEGAHTQGTVTQKEFLAYSDDSDYVLHYAFTAHDGTSVKSRRNVSSGLWKRLRVGDTIQVLYSREQPRWSFPEGHGLMSLGLALFFTVVLVPITLLGLLILLARAGPASSAVDSAAAPPPS